jgi:hypothetical protein
MDRGGQFRETGSEWDRGKRENQAALPISRRTKGYALDTAFSSEMLSVLQF